MEKGNVRYRKCYDSTHGKVHDHRPRINNDYNKSKYYIRIGTTGKLYVSKHEVAGYEKDGFKVHKEE